MNRRFLTPVVVLAALAAAPASADAAPASSTSETTALETTQDPVTGTPSAPAGPTTGATVGNTTQSTDNSSVTGDTLVPQPVVSGTVTVPSSYQSSAQTSSTTQSVTQMGDEGVHVGDTVQTVNNSNVTILVTIQIFNTGMIVGSTSTPAPVTSTDRSATADTPAANDNGAAVVTGAFSPAYVLSDHYLIQPPSGWLIVGTITDFEPIAPPPPEPVVVD